MKIFFSIILIFFTVTVFAQQECIFKGFMRASWPEKFWAISHPFIAKKAWKISKEALRLTEEIKKDTMYDGDADGGQVDAFRHTFWMASLAQKFNKRKVYKLGAAHEKGNYIDFKKERIEECSLPDSVAGEMDFRNNDIGIKLGLTNKNASQTEIIDLVKNAIKQGDVWIINKNKQKQSIDCSGQILKKEEYWGKWVNKRCLVKSNIKRK